MRQVISYQSADGRLFDSSSQCQEYEKEQAIDNHRDQLVSKPLYIMIIGMPGSGKSYLRAKLVTQAYMYGLPLTELSTDDWIDMVSANNHLTYSENFKEFIAEAEDQLRQKRSFAFDHNWSVIHDQTNLTVGSRRKKLSQVPKTYRKIAVYMTTPEGVSSERRNERIGKEISPIIIHNMLHSYQMPTLDEGFDLIVPDYLAEKIFI